MTFEEVLNEAVAMIQRLGCASYRSVQRQFDLEDDYLEDVKEALLYTYADRLCDDGQGFVWTGEPPPPNAHSETDKEKMYLNKPSRQSLSVPHLQKADNGR